MASPFASITCLMDIDLDWNYQLPSEEELYVRRVLRIPSYRKGSEDLNAALKRPRIRPRPNLHLQHPGLLMVDRKKPFNVRFNNQVQVRFYDPQCDEEDEQQQ